MWRALEMASKLHEFITAVDNTRGGYRCFSCDTDCKKKCDMDTCKLVESSVEMCVQRFVADRMPQFNMTNRMCGQDGIAFILDGEGKKRVIKAVLVADAVSHGRRFATWTAAADHGIGPNVTSGRFCTVTEPPLSFGISLICMSYWPACVEAEESTAQKIVRLIRRASNAGMLHADPHHGNVRCGPKHAIFIDCEDMIHVSEHKHVAEYLMLCCMVVDSNMLVQQVYTNALRPLLHLKHEAATFVRSITDDNIRETFELALQQSQLKMTTKTMQESYAARRAPLAHLNH